MIQSTKTFESIRHDVRIVMDKDFIKFQYPSQDDREFYSIPTNDWNAHWQFHMRKKAWFTDEMFNFINENHGK